MDDADVVVVDEHENAGSGVCSADADVVQASVDAQGDGSGVVDAVGADAVVGVELGLQLGWRGGAGLAVEPFLEGLVEAFDLAAGDSGWS